MQKNTFALGKTNYLLIALSFALVIIGFLLMLGPGSTPEQFNPEIFSFRRIVLAPTISFIGFIAMVYAILYRGKKEKNKVNE